MPPEKKKKQHRARQSGTKADKKQAKKDRRAGKTNVKGQNPKAFGRSSKGITARIQQSRKAEIQERKLHAPLIDRSYAAEEPPPIVVGVVVCLSPRLRTRACVHAMLSQGGPAAHGGRGAAGAHRQQHMCVASARCWLRSAMTERATRGRARRAWARRR